MRNTSVENPFLLAENPENTHREPGERQSSTPNIRSSTPDFLINNKRVLDLVLGKLPRIMKFRTSDDSDRNDGSDSAGGFGYVRGQNCVMNHI